VLEPFLSEAIQMGIARQLNDLAAASGGTVTNGQQRAAGFSEVFCPESGPRRRVFMDAYLKGVRLYNRRF